RCFIAILRSSLLPQPGDRRKVPYRALHTSCGRVTTSGAASRSQSGSGDAFVVVVSRPVAAASGQTKTGGMRRNASRPVDVCYSRAITRSRAPSNPIARASLRSCHQDDGARLADVAAGLVLVAVVHHHLHAIVVARNEPEVVDVPAHLGAVPLIPSAGR